MLGAATDRKWNHLASKYGRMGIFHKRVLIYGGSGGGGGNRRPSICIFVNDLCAIFKTNLITFNKRYKTVDNCWIYGLLFVKLDGGLAHFRDRQIYKYIYLRIYKHVFNFNAMTF